MTDVEVVVTADVTDIIIIDTEFGPCYYSVITMDT